MRAVGFFTTGSYHDGASLKNSITFFLNFLRFHPLFLTDVTLQVNSQDLKSVARLIKEEMENAILLKVKLPVKLKVGKKWGEMTDFEIPE